MDMLKIIGKIGNIFKRTPKVTKPTKPTKPTLTEMLEYINKEYHFNQYDENLINEIYSKLIEYGSVKVRKESKYKYIMELKVTLAADLSQAEVFNYEVTQKGLETIEILDED